MSSEGLAVAGRDAEVESVLLEIRQHLRGASDADDVAISAAQRSRETLARIEASLAVLGRAWDRLPPVMSDRTGWRARLEIWLKRRLRRATNWLTWEQININAAARDALRSAHAALVEQDERQAELGRRIDALETELRELRLHRRRPPAQLQGAPKP
ncbi:MAG: hypothetical protein ACJ741_17690 [Pyrinomonadaceae bacterium]